MKKTIRIKFVGFYRDFDPNNNFILNSLKKYYNVVQSEQPEYLFSSCFSDDYLDYDCIRIFYTGENICPDFRAFDYAIGFEYLQFMDRYLRYPNYAIPELYGEDVALMKQKHCNVDMQMAQKQDFCSFVVSNGTENCAVERTDFFYKLSDYKKVNSGGRYLNNIGLPEGVPDKLEFQRKHKFSIAFENSSHAGYTTEKIIQAFAAGTIPIYWGDPMITKDFNQNAFIVCGQENEWNDIIRRIREIDENEALYRSMMACPALVQSDLVEKYQMDLDIFLRNIVDQDVEKAFRRDRMGTGKVWALELKRMRAAKKNRIIRFYLKRKIRRG